MSRTLSRRLRALEGQHHIAMPAPGETPEEWLQRQPDHVLEAIAAGQPGKTLSDDELAVIAAGHPQEGRP